MKATGTAGDILAACEIAREEYQKSVDYFAPKTARARLRYIETKTRWDIFRRSSEYWAGRWENSSDKALTIQCNGTGWLEMNVGEYLRRVERNVDNLSTLDSFTLDENEVYALSYIHADNT